MTEQVGYSHVFTYYLGILSGEMSLHALPTFQGGFFADFVELIFESS